MPPVKVQGAALIILTISLVGAYALPQESKFSGVQGVKLSKPIPAGSKVFVTPLPDGFETFLTAGIIKKQVPLTVVNNKEKADFEISAISDSEKAGWAKMFFMGSAQSREEASIKVTDLKTDEIVYAYSVHKGSSVRGKQSAAEACAKHLKEKIQTGK